MLKLLKEIRGNHYPAMSSLAMVFLTSLRRVFFVLSNRSANRHSQFIVTFPPLNLFQGFLTVDCSFFFRSLALRQLALSSRHLAQVVRFPYDHDKLY